MVAAAGHLQRDAARLERDEVARGDRRSVRERVLEVATGRRRAGRLRDLHRQPEPLEAGTDEPGVLVERVPTRQVQAGEVGVVEHERSGPDSAADDERQLLGQDDAGGLASARIAAVSAWVPKSAAASRKPVDAPPSTTWARADA